MFIEFREGAFVNTENIAYLTVEPGDDGAVVIGLVGGNDVLYADGEYADNLLDIIFDGCDEWDDTLDECECGCDCSFPGLEEGFPDAEEDEDEDVVSMLEKSAKAEKSDEEIMDEVFDAVADFLQANLPAHMGSMDFLISVERD